MPSSNQKMAMKNLRFKGAFPLKNIYFGGFSWPCLPESSGYCLSQQPSCLKTSMAKIAIALKIQVLITAGNYSIHLKSYKVLRSPTKSYEVLRSRTKSYEILLIHATSHKLLLHKFHKFLPIPSGHVWKKTIVVSLNGWYKSSPNIRFMAARASKIFC